ncbi:glycoside hydrolase family 5 protein [Novosphingobium sp.]|uniref:glycoside hydrolase family 5 protein n=1 Tax=Novosphingobium sp. TaxID=1874826 RepID=UPI0025EA980F|nr:glycoside hydrolase family 5 protein [Novosphingobium sp.]
MKRVCALAIVLAAGSLPAQARDLPVGPCINMGNSLESVPENAGGRRMMPADFARIRAAGFQTVRIPVRWSARAAKAAPYTIKPGFQRRAVQVVDMALDAGLNVIVNDHHYEELFTDPAANAARLAGIWQQVAAVLAARPTQRLWFEIENEPHDKLSNANLLATLAPSLAAIRATNPDRPVIIGGDFWSGVDSLATLQLPDDPNVYPTFHYYEPFRFTHQGAPWITSDMPPVGRIYGSSEDRQRLKTDLAKVKAYAARTGLTPFIGETGAYEAYIPLAQRIQYAKAVHDTFAPENVAVCQWAYTNTFPWYDAAGKRWQPGLRAAIGLPED